MANRPQVLESRPCPHNLNHCQKPLARAAAAPAPKGDRVSLVDGSGYIFRAYHALPPLNRKSDGLQVNAVLGFCNMLWKLLRDMKPEERQTIWSSFDKSEKTFPHRHVSGLQGQPLGAARRPDPAIR